MRFFNTAGPVDPEIHYCIPPLERLDLNEVMLLIQQRKYFVLHAPRQVDKTSYLLALTEHLLGQPWLVNALAEEACFEIAEGRDRSQPITRALIEEAKENLILCRETHLDQLTDKLREPRVRRVIEAVLVGGQLPTEVSDDDIQYVTDLGLIRRKPHVAIANPIYQEVVPRALAITAQDFIPQ